MRAGEATRCALRAAGRKPLVWFNSRSIDAQQVDRAVDRLCATLDPIATAGDRVGVWAWNSPETLVAHLAAERAGLVRVAVDPAAPLNEATQIAEAAQVQAMVVDREHSFDHSTIATIEPAPGELWAPGPVTGFDNPEITAEAPALLVVRGVMPEGLLAIPLSVGNWEAHMTLTEALYRNGTFGGGLDGDPFFVTAQQMQYGTGLLGTFTFLRMGLPQAILKVFDAEEMRDIVVEHDATATFLVPGMMTRLADVMPQPQPDPWRLTILYGGAPIPLHDLLRCMTALGTNLVQLYGRFEGGWPLTALGPGDHRQILEGDEQLAGSCGNAVDGVQLDLRPIPDAEGRELRVKSPCVSREYTDPDGWCALGDVATVDDTGHYYLHGRIDGMINTGSFHVYPAEVVTAIQEEFPDISDALVEGREDPRWGQAVATVIRWKPGVEPLSTKELRTRLARRIAKYKVPTIVEQHRSST